MFECLHDLSFAELAPFLFLFGAIVVAFIGALLVDLFPIFEEQEHHVRTVIARLERTNAALKSMREEWQQEARFCGLT